MANSKRTVFVVVVAALVLLAFLCREKYWGYQSLGARFVEWRRQIAKQEIDKAVEWLISGLRDGRFSVDSAGFKNVGGPREREKLLKDVRQDYETVYGYWAGCTVDVSVIFHEGGELVLDVGEFKNPLALFCSWGRSPVSVIKYEPRGNDNELVPSK